MVIGGGEGDPKDVCSGGGGGGWRDPKQSILSYSSASDLEICCTYYRQETMYWNLHGPKKFPPLVGSHTLNLGFPTHFQMQP
jgi:hypothetical protein